MHMTSHPTMRSMAYSFVFSLRSGSLAMFEKERVLLDINNTISCPAASVSRWMDTVLSMPFF